MDAVQKITDAIEPSLEDMGYAIVLIKVTEAGRQKTLTVMAERQDDTIMGFDDCTNISQTISALLDVDDPIQTAYNLEVCSPGLDRPLTKIADFVKYKGYEAKCETFTPIDGRKRFRGVIDEMNGDNVVIALEKEEATIAFSNIRTAKLVMNDELLSAALKQNGPEHKQKKKKNA